jgi:hypothetical protein
LNWGGGNEFFCYFQKPLINYCSYLFFGFDFMSGLFGEKKVDQKDRLKQNKRIITKAIREIDKERTRLEQEERKFGADMKKAAAAGHMV